MQISEVVGLGEAQQLPTGDTKYVCHPEEVYVSKEGQRLIDGGSSILDFLDTPYNQIPNKPFFSGQGGASIVTKEVLEVDGHRMELAVKRVLAATHSLTGSQQFLATKLLLSEGGLCAPPLIASRRVLITPWITGRLVFDKEDLDIREAIARLFSLARRLEVADIWNNNWVIDAKPDNFIDSYELDEFVCIDPIYLYKQELFSAGEIAVDAVLVDKLGKGRC